MTEVERAKYKLQDMLRFGGIEPDDTWDVVNAIEALIDLKLAALDKHREEKAASERRTHGEAMAARMLADQKRWLAASPIQDDQEKGPS